MPENTTPTAHPHPSARSPFVFDLRELGRRAGALREYRRAVPAPAGLGLDLIGVPEGAPLTLELRLESVTEGVLVTGTVRGPLTGQCARCLDPVADEFAVDVCELFAYPDSATDETTEEDEVRRLDGELLDVEPVVRDAVVPDLPWTPLCRPDCAGRARTRDDRPALGGTVGVHPGRRRRAAHDEPGVDVAVPKRRMSRSNTRSRRAQWKTSAPTLVRCPNRACGELVRPHTACEHCGQYAGKQVLAV